MTLTVLVLACFTQTHHLATNANYGQPSAALWKDQLFAAVTRAELYRGKFAPETRGIRAPAVYANPYWWLPLSSQAKLDIRDDRLLLLSGGEAHLIFPMAEVPLLEYGEFGETLRKARGHQSMSAFTSKYSGDDCELIFPRRRKHDMPLEVERPATDSPWLRYINSGAGRYSLQIAGPRSVRLFHAHGDKLFISIEPDYLTYWYRDAKGNIKDNQPKPPARELRTGKLPAAFNERFAAYTADKRDYLVTANGKAYMAVPKGKSEVEVTTVWNDPVRKIVGVVHDTETDAVYGWGFAPFRLGTERFYVKFGPKPVAVPYKCPAALPGDCSDAYIESYECARAFRLAADKK